jgi:hypothetical protein
MRKTRHNVPSSATTGLCTSPEIFGTWAGVVGKYDSNSGERYGSQSNKVSKLLDGVYGAHGPAHSTDVFSTARRPVASECEKSSKDIRGCVERWLVRLRLPIFTYDFNFVTVQVTIQMERKI